METNDWINELKEGDIVFVSQRRDLALRKVMRLTPKQIILAAGNTEGQRFNKATGMLVGGTVWSNSHLRKPTEELYKEYKIQTLARKVAGLLVNLSVPKDIDALEDLVSCLSKYQK